MGWFLENQCSPSENGLKRSFQYTFPLRGKLRGTFPDLRGLRVFGKSVSTFPFPFPEPSRTFEDCGFLTETVSVPFLPSRFPSRNLPGPSRIAVSLKHVFLGTVSGVKVKTIIMSRPHTFISKGGYDGCHIIYNIYIYIYIIHIWGSQCSAKA